MSRINFNSELMNQYQTSNQLYDIEIKKNDDGEEIYVGTGNVFNEENNSEIWFLKIKF